MSQFDAIEGAGLDERTPIRTVPPERRAQTRIVFERIYRSRKPIGGRHVAYVEAGRTYDRLAPANDPGCPPTTQFGCAFYAQPEVVPQLLHL